MISLGEERAGPRAERNALRRWTAAWVGASIAALMLTAAPGAAGQFIEPTLAQQVQALLDEKTSRTTAQQKMDSQLLRLLYPAKFAMLLHLVDIPATDPNGNVQVRIDLTQGADPNLLAQVIGRLLIGLNLPPPVAAGIDSTVRAVLPLGKLDQVAAMPTVRFIDVERKPLHNKVSVSEGDKTHQAEVARSSYGVNGAGQKVCVVSDGINSVASRVGTGDLPAGIEVLPGQAGGGDEGTAMLEIVYDLAPGAKLGFATSNGGESVFAQNILDLADTAKGKCNIIVDDTDYVTESPFQDGVVATAVNTVTANGVLYFSSAGNSGNLDSNMSGTWEGDFNAAHNLPLASNPGYVMHEFVANVSSNAATSATNKVYTHWADAAGRASVDYDLFVLDSAGKYIVAFSTNTQNGTQNPFEYTEAAAPYTFPAGSRIVIARPVGQEDRVLNLQWYRGTLQYATSGATRGHSAAAGSFSVAATPAAQPYVNGLTPNGPYPNAFTASAKVEIFSSDGPRRIFFDFNGNLLPGVAANNFKAATNGGVVRQKPDITAADGVRTETPGFNTFYGTSAAAPHAAAIAALVRQANPSATALQIRTKLIASALAINNSTRTTGAGVLMASAALQPAVQPLGTLDVDGNGQYDALTDGLLVLRWLFGLNGTALTNGAVAPGAQRSDAVTQVLPYLNARRAALDVDNNSSTDALTDGLMILRYMFGLRGNALISGAIGANALRNTAPAIEQYIATLMP